MCFNILIEQLWLSLEYEATSLHEIASASRTGARSAIGSSFATSRGRTRRRTEGPRLRPARSETRAGMTDKPLRALPTSLEAQQQQQKDRFMGIPAA